MLHALILLLSLIATIVIELAVLIALCEDRRRILLGSVVINVLTNVPYNLWIVWAWPSWPTIALAEVAIILTEAACYLRLTDDPRQSFYYSMLCNIISCLAGLVVQMTAGLVSLM